MRKMKKIIAGVMSALMLLGNCPVDELAAYATENDDSVATATDAAETVSDNTVTIYKGGAFAFCGIQSNWYSTSDAPNSSNVNAYSLAYGYEMTESSVTAEPHQATDKNLIKAVYYSFGAPGYQNLQTDMEEIFLASNAVTEEERAGISYLLISGYADDIYNLESDNLMTAEEEMAVENVKAGISELPTPSEAFQVYVVDDTATQNPYDLVFWQENGAVTTEIDEEDVPQLTAAGVTTENSYWKDMKNIIQDNGLLKAGADGYGTGNCNATSNWSCAGWVSRVILLMGEEDVAKAHNESVSGLQNGFLETSDKFVRIYNMVGNGSGSGCTSYGTAGEAAEASDVKGSKETAVANAEADFIKLVEEGKIKAGDIIIFYNEGGTSHAAIMGDTWTGDVPNIYNALNETVGSTSKTPVSWLFTSAVSDEKSACGFAIYRYEVYGSISLTKESGQTDITEDSNHKSYYDLSGAVYEVTDSNDNVVGLFKTDSNGTGYVVSSAEDADGNTIKASLVNAPDVNGTTLTVRLGDYTVTEIKAPSNGSYKISMESHFVSVSDESNVKVNDTDYIETARVFVTKKSSNPDITEGNSCYSLEGAKYTIYEADGKTVAEYITSKDSNGKITGTAKAENLVTDEDGNLLELEMAFGTYYVREVEASKGYMLDTCSQGTKATMHSIELNDAFEIYKVECEEPIRNDPQNIALVKWDEETNRVSSLGGASLEHAYFTVRYYDGYYTEDNLPQNATRTWVIQTLYNEQTGVYATKLDDKHRVSGDAFYYKKDVAVLPLGTVTVEETKAPEGYKLVSDGGVMYDANGEVDSGIFLGQIRINDKAITGASLYVGDTNTLQGDIVTANPLTTTAISVYEPIVRTDLSFSKLDYETREEMAGIPFRITSKTTGESHIVVTNSAGYYSTNTSHMKHGDNTNANDKYVSQNLTSYDDCVESGIWFYGTADKSEWNENLIDESKGALPYDTYIIEELPCSKNKGKQLVVDIEVQISETDDSKVVNIGFISDMPEPIITTTAWDEETQSHFSLADEDVTITDTVSYNWLTAGRTYTVKGILMDKDSAEDEDGAKPLLDSNGNPIVASQTFTVDEDFNINEKEKCGSVDVTYNFDGRNLSGKSYVIFAYLFEGDSKTPLYENGKLNLEGAVMTRDGEVVRHADITDENQTGSFPRIDTAAWTEKTGVNVSPAEENVVIYDKVSYSGLIPTYEYKLIGTLMNRDTGEVILDEDGNPVTLTKYFIADDESGEVEMEFEPIDSTGMEGNATVVYERLYWNNREYAQHVNLDDANQSVFYPVIGTQAKDSETDEDRACADDSVTIIDTVSYENLMPGYEYSLYGELMNKRTGKAVTSSDGTPITAEASFTPEDFSGSVDVTFTFDAIDADLEGETVVCYEALFIKDVELTAHKEINDLGQTIYFPSVKTSLRDADTGIQNTVLDNEIILIDTVSYTNLAPGKTYRLEGTLMNRETGKNVTVNGVPVKAETVFTAEASSGTADVTFTFDGIAAGLKEENELVAFETLYYEKTVDEKTKEYIIGIHKDISDVNQTVSIPGIKTSLVGRETEDHFANAGEKVTIVDHVTYTGLVPGKKYTVSGTLMTEGKNGEAEKLLVNGKEVTSSVTFTATKKEGVVDVIFTLDASALAGEHVVAFEECTYEGKTVAVHADIHDDDQTLDFPKIQTMAKDSETKTHISLCDEDVTIIDTVSYENLSVNRTYTVRGTLMDKKTGKAITDADGNKVTAEAEFNTNVSKIGTAISVDENGNIIESESGDTEEVRTTSGTVQVTFRFNAEKYALEGVETVVFEELYYKKAVVAEHKDITDKGQTITFGKIETTAKDSETGMHTSAGGTVTIVDTVSYSGLLPNKSYTVSGVLMDKTTGEPLLADGKEVTAEKTFKADKADGTVELSFTFDASALQGTTVVVFETVYYKKNPVAVHADLNDHEQSVYFPKIMTTATDKADGDKKLSTTGTVTIVDKVSYTSLAIGETYVMEGVLMDKSTGKPLLVNGKEVTARREFTPETADGVIEMEFTFTADGLSGKELVVFENLYLKDTNTLVADHADINDADQTVSVTGNHHPKTGDETPVVIAFVIGILSLAAACILFFGKRRKEKK